jgi:hypothetical protein
VSSWIVDNVPSWLLLLGLVVVIAGGAVFVQIYARHRFPWLKGEEHNDVTRFAFGVIAFVYAIFTGFMINVLWGQVTAADAVAQTEGAAGVQLARDLHVFDKSDSDRIRQRLLEYERATQAEWPLVARGHRYPEADGALQRLYVAYEEVQAGTDIQKAFLATSLTNLDKLSQSRTQRVLIALTDTGPSGSLWAVVFLTAGLVLGCAIIYGGEKPGRHYAMVAIVSVLVATNLFLILELSHPYVGEIATSREPLREVIKVLSPSPS